jgi:polyhydroxyalkanoate synthesis repressor PhaR
MFSRPRNRAKWDLSGGAKSAGAGAHMTSEQRPITIKKYANRRLYNTGSSTYVTLEDLALMVKKGEDFVVYDAKSGDDITRSVLAQVIFEQEAKVGQSLLPITFLRQLIRFYGDSMQMLIPSYLEFSLDRFTADQQKFRDQMTSALGGKGTIQAQMFEAVEEQTRKNMSMFRQALTMFNPFAAKLGAEGATRSAEPPLAANQEADLEAMRRQLDTMQKTIEELARKS